MVWSVLYYCVLAAQTWLDLCWRQMNTLSFLQYLIFYSHFIQPDAGDKLWPPAFLDAKATSSLSQASEFVRSHTRLLCGAGCLPNYIKVITLSFGLKMRCCISWKFVLSEWNNTLKTRLYGCTLTNRNVVGKWQWEKTLDEQLFSLSRVVRCLQEKTTFLSIF